MTDTITHDITYELEGRDEHWGRGDATQFKTPPTSVAAALTAAGLDWEVQLTDFDVQCDDVALEHNYRAIVRPDTAEVLGVVGGHYHALQNADAFAFVDRLTDCGDITYAWQTGRGREVGVVVRWAEQVRLPFTEDSIQPNAVFTTRHDGQGSARMTITATQIACLNQVPSLRANSLATWRATHSSLLAGRLDAAPLLAQAVDSWSADMVADMSDLASTGVTDKHLAEVLDASMREVQMGEKAVAEARDAILLGRRTSPTLADEMRPTAFGALHAVTEHWDHNATFRSGPARFNANQPGGRGYACRRRVAQRLLER